MSEIVLERREGPVLVLTLNDPERANPLSAALADRLYRALAEAAEDATVRAVVLTGAGRHFSAGADLAALERLAEGGTEADNREDSERLERLYAELLDHPKLTVAAVHGAAIGGGCGLATACDLVIAERSARFGYTEITIGFIPALVSTFLTRRVPGHVARRLLLDPGLVDGERAVALGLADELVDDGAAIEAAIERARSIAHRSSGAALAATKRLLNLTVGMSWRDALMAASRANVQQRRHPDCRHGVRTFLATKSTPDWLAEQEKPSDHDGEEEADR
ncbi:MAG TPA: enoyl-CoA hydratase/isomerase family protein [Thermoanaerobaculales bacterium]|nr:enoyl-CoA hydratase/isomerase family protein [Thermoanaerobaculales bacterium]